MPVLDTRSMAPPHPMLSFMCCPDCGSGHFDPPGITDFSDIGQSRDDFWRFYVEVGGGVWETIWPFLAEKSRAPRTLLDVGCGFGFAVDYWQRIVGGESVGVELADYGQIGARLLGITVYDNLLQECPELAGRRFDIVYASEVIEHVADPSAFVALLAHYVADDGVLVMTTPSAAFIRQENHSTTLHAALAPGFHGFLLSPQAFGDAARRNGFAHVDVRRFGERQILWASRTPINVDSSPAGMFATYIAYLEAHIAQDDCASPFWQGMAYRYVKDCVNLGRLAEAHGVARRLLDAVVAAFGPHVVDPAATIERIRPCARLQDVGVVIPYFMPSLYFFLGMLAQRVDHDAARAERMFRGAIDTTLEMCRFGWISFLEAISLIWPARMAVVNLCFARGAMVEGARMSAQIAAEGGLCLRENGFAIADRDVIEIQLPRAIDQFSDQGQVAVAATMFAGYCTYVRKKFGEPYLRAAGVNQALTEGSARVPLDPLFAPAFAAMQAHRELGSSEGVVRGLADAADAAARWSSHPQLGPRMREHARRLRRLLPADRAPANPAWSFEMTYKIPKGGDR